MPIITAGHLSHNTVSSLLVLPLGDTAQSLRSLDWTIRPVPFSVGQLGWLALNLLGIAMGTVALWQRARWAALLPGMFCLVYALSSAVGGFSGQRFILPADWVPYFYFFAGLAWLVGALGARAGWEPARMAFWLGEPAPAQLAAESPAKRHALPLRAVIASLALPAIGLLVLGGLLPLEERLIPTRYPGLSDAAARAQILDRAQGALSPAQMDSLRHLLDDPRTIVLHGVALYPRQVSSVEDEIELVAPEPPLPYPYVNYLYLGAERAWVYQPGPAQGALPSGSEVLLAGRRSKAGIQAFLTLTQDSLLFAEP